MRHNLRIIELPIAVAVWGNAFARTLPTTDTYLEALGLGDLGVPT